MKKNIIILLIFLFALSTNAQQDPQYTQYMYNMNVINPAYAGTEGKDVLSLTSRNQWINIDNAPRTLVMSFSSERKKNVPLVCTHNLGLDVFLLINI